LALIKEYITTHSPLNVKLVQVRNVHVPDYNMVP